ncbi:MAG: hypothetical protein JSW71_21730 [Gemmatimonadota bacterium]|nr:MAG: hypothetical protein JSW71_21730 [Gemmatimonadota bacterium]
MSHGTYIKTGREDLDELVPLIGSFLQKDVMELFVDGKRVSGFRTPDAKSIWIRDHSDMLRGGRYFHADVTSAVEHFAETQSASGRIFDYFTTFPEKPPCERENWTKYVRVPVEADVEYRFVKGAYLAWQACGDDEWITRLLPSMERALRYIQGHDWYWDDERGLVKRAYTIDTWDFAYSAGTHEWLQFQFNEHTFWGIMHGDNSGYYEAFRIMADLYDRLGDPDSSERWRQQADTLRENMNAVCWNGDFYTHFVKLSPVTIGGVDEATQLSLSNPMDINRGTASHEMAVAIIEEYQSRRRRTKAFAEWFSIDPPFPDGIFGDEKLIGGAYVNGGIMPLVGGELAKAAFDHGFEEYGVDILARYHSLVSEKQETYLWYFPDGTPASVEASTSPEAEPTDGWGSSAMLYALTDGLAGAEDLGRGFDEVRLSPRWPAARVNHADVELTYVSSGKHVAYDYRLGESAIEMVVSCQGTVHFHVLLPRGIMPESVTIAGGESPFCVSQVQRSQYVDFTSPVDGEAEVTIKLA